MTTNKLTLDRSEVEAKIVVLLKTKLIENQITGDRAQEIAQCVLKMIPEDINEQKLLDTLPQLAGQFDELAGVLHKILQERDDKMKSEAVPKIRAMLKTIS